MYPRLFELGPVTVYTYGLLLAAAYLLGLYLAVRRARSFGLDGNRVLDLGIYIIISALVGAKLLLLIVDFEYFRRQPAELWTLARSGGVFYGGLVLAFVVGAWYVRKHRLPFSLTADAIAPGIALGHVVGRLGCLMAGCCYGRPTTEPWGITFTDPFANANVGTPLHVALHPTQLYEAGAELVILLLLLGTERIGRRFAGRTFWLYILLYGISRFTIEFFRGDPRGMLWGFSTSQIISIVLIPVAAVMLVVMAKRGAPVIAEQAAQPAQTSRPRRRGR
jgi:phosphatidylglycerol:prolipoprotein diacylglycerol transferase